MIDTTGIDAAIPDVIRDAPFSALLGIAGTGKSTLARIWSEQDESVILCSTTGISAVNLGTVTINSLLWYFDSRDLRQKYEQGQLGAALRKLRGSDYTRLVVDEVSMMPGEQLDYLCFAIDEINVGVDDPDLQMKLTVTGDWAQLPPVDAPYAFERPAWERFRPATVTLTHPHRQADPEFVRALHAVRRGDVREAMQFFNPLITPTAEEDFHGTTVVALNAEVERINKLRLMNLPGQTDYYPAKRWDRQRSEWKYIPDVLELKRGAIVMILSNRYLGVPDEDELPEMLYANGDLAEYVGQESETVAVVRLFRNGQEARIGVVRRLNTTATGAKGEKAPRTETHGGIQYVPLRLAFATTCHKVQGLSLDRVQVNLHNHFWTTPGMAYVGLSRARSIAGLRIVCTERQFEKRVVMNPKLRGWL